MGVIKPLLGTTPLKVSSPPHWHCGRTIWGLHGIMLFSLFPAAAFAVMTFGIGAFRVMALSCSVAVITEYLCARLMNRKPQLHDLHALVTGLLFAFLLPSQAPWWLVTVGSSMSIIMGKMIFGGIGGTPLSAPLVGWAICRISWKSLMDPDFMILHVNFPSPLTQLKYFGADAVSNLSLLEMMMGQQIGGLGAVMVGPLLVGGLFMITSKTIRPHVPIAFMVGVFCMGMLFKAIDPALAAQPVFHFFAGATLFGAFFLAPDYPASPVGRGPMLIYGFLAGAMVIVIRRYGIYTDGVPFAILVAQLLTPLLDRLGPKPFGYKERQKAGQAS